MPPNTLQVIVATAPVVVFSAATPGQGGQWHINEQPHAYWMSRFAKRRMAYDRTQSADFRESWQAAGVDFWYADNVLVFRQEESNVT